MGEKDKIIRGIFILYFLFVEYFLTLHSALEVELYMMKKRLWLFFLPGIIFALNGCRQETTFGGGEVPEPESWHESVVRAKAFFESVYSPEEKTRTALYAPAAAVLSSMDVDPDWERSLFSENSDESYLEFPLLSVSRYGSGPVDPANPEEDIRLVDRRLVVRETGQTGELHLYTALWIPADPYSEAIMPGCTMLDKGDFSGRIYLFYPDGQFYWGACFRQGEPVASVNLLEEPEEPAGTPMPTRSMTCTTYYEGFMMQTCWHDENGTLLHCSEWVRVITDVYETCTLNEIDGGGGSGGPGVPPPTAVAPKAHALFQSSSLRDDEWEQLEKLLDSLVRDCFGDALYDRVLQKITQPLNIAFDSNLSSSGRFDVNNGIGIITLKNIEANVLLHELLHAYQALNRDDLSNKINLELETWVAQYRFVSKQSNFYQGNEWYDMYSNTQLGLSIAVLNNSLDSKGALKNGHSLSQFEKDVKLAVDWFGVHPIYWRYTFNSNKKGLENFKNLIDLSKDC